MRITEFRTPAAIIIRALLWNRRIDMSHKDAPPETESQKACREWWEKARPTVKRAWGRAQDGSFLAEETRLIHKSWEAASQQANAEVERLRELCGMAYQLAGVHDAPEKWLDALSNAASGRPFSTDGLLPYMPDAVCEAEVRALELEREIEALRAEVEEWKRVAAAQAELHDEAESSAERLAEALALLPDEIVMVEHNPDGAPRMFCCGREVKLSWLHDLQPTHNEECWYARMRAMRDAALAKENSND